MDPQWPTGQFHFTSGLGETERDTVYRVKRYNVHLKIIVILEPNCSEALQHARCSDNL